MSIGVVIACAEQTLAAQLREHLLEIADVEVLAVAENSSELVTAVLDRGPAVVIVHDGMDADAIHPVVRDLSLRRPASVVVMVTDGSAAAITAAMNVGARSVLELPLQSDDVRRAVQGAVDWSEQMERILAGSEAVETGGFRARVLAVTGGKGGVGTTTIATHLAWQHVRDSRDRTLLIDLDLEKGDVSSFVDVKYRISIADLAKVAGDLSVRTVLDGTLEHESGMFLLLPPEDIRDVEWVTPQALREILTLLRGEFDNIIIDAGSHLTPLQAAVVEAADAVVTVITPDLVAIRGARRAISAWESLGARKAADVLVLVNRQARDRELQARSIAQLINAPLLTTSMQESTRTLEASVNSRTPELVRHAGWWKTVRALSQEIGLAQPESRGRLERPAQVAPATEQDMAPPPAPEQTDQGGRRARRRDRAEVGAVSIELLGVLPIILLILVLIWQMLLAGVTWVWTGQAASDAARAVSIGRTTHQVREVATDRLPDGMTPGALVEVHNDNRVRVSVPVPLVAPGVAALPWRIEVERKVVAEP